MVVSTSSDLAKGKKHSMLENDPETMTPKVRRGAGKYCLSASILLNALLIAAVITAGVFIWMYKTELCNVKIGHKVDEMRRNGHVYQIRGCDVIPVLEARTDLAYIKADKLGCELPTEERQPVPCAGYLLFANGRMEDEQGQQVIG